MIAAGGALGGAAVTLVAPHVFNTFFEWKLGMFVGTIGVLTLILHAMVNRAMSNGPSTASEKLCAGSRLLLVVLLLPASFVLLDMVEYLHSPKKGIRFQNRNFFGDVHSSRTKSRRPADE